MVSAHRAGPAPGLPENAIEALDAVLDIGPAMIEVDVRTTGDGVMVLLHDRDLNRTTTGNGRISSKNYTQLERVRLKDPEGATTPYRIPTLHDALLATKGRGILSLDLKAVETDRVVRLVEETDSMNWVSFVAYDLDDAIEIRRAAPDAMIALTIRSFRALDDARDALGGLERVTAWTGTRDPNPRLYRALAESGVEVTLGTFGTADRQEPATARRAYTQLKNQGVDIIASDRPRLVMSAIPPDKVAACMRI